MERKLKVYGYVIRERSGHRQVLVFDHVDEPDAGTQVPGGSVEEGESLEQAVLREVREEAGLDGLTILGEAGVYQWPVSGGTEDQGLHFRFYWMDLREAARLLAGEQGSQLPPLFA